MKSRILMAIVPVLACFALLPQMQAVSPAPDGCYPNFTTAEGCNALNSLTMGIGDTGVGWRSLFSNSTGNFNTGVGVGALVLNNADSNTAVGAAALLFNTSGQDNTATGSSALEANTEGGGNTAVGSVALLSNTQGSTNTAVGVAALFTSTGSGNVAIGASAGANLGTGSNNVYIGADIEGFASDDGVCRIGSIYGATITSGTEVFINSDNRLGTFTSSKRFKQNITPTSGASEVLYELQPVRFQYKKEIDPDGRWQFGLVAEEVEKVNPDLVVHDKEGKPYSVRYDQVNAMLLNEFQKEHRKVEEQQARIAHLGSIVVQQGATIAQQQKSFESSLAEERKQIKALISGLQKVSAQLELNKSAPRTVLNNR